MTEEIKQPTGHKVSPETIQKMLEACRFMVDQPEGLTATHVHVYDAQGYYLASGFSGCVDPRNYDAEIGKKVALNHAMSNAETELWRLEGYALNKDMEAGRYIPTPAERDLPPHVLRLLIEHNELAAKLANLQSFLNSPKSSGVSKEERNLLMDRSNVMVRYIELLHEQYKLLQGL